MTDAAPPVLSVRELSVAYVAEGGLVRAVDRVSFEVARGEVLGMAGESGCGKSTVAQALLRILPPPAVITGGQVLLEGQDLLGLDEPALRIMTFLEATRDPEAPGRLIEALQTRPLAQIAALPWVVGPLGPVLDRHVRSIETIRAAARLTDGVAFLDLAAAGLEAGNKFVLYWLFPEARYAVTVSQDAKRSKVSVGSNPWARPARAHDISSLCERYGGGGHPVVGAVTLGPSRLDDARRIAREIVATLRSPPEAAA
jgi:energy-coupling factor transporter ATP-binding protein EcfA2